MTKRKAVQGIEILIKYIYNFYYHLQSAAAINCKTECVVSVSLAFLLGMIFCMYSLNSHHYFETESQILFLVFILI